MMSVVRDIIIYGAGKMGKKLLEKSKEYYDVNVLGFLDQNLKEEIYGLPILSFEEARKYCAEIPIIISNASFNARRQIFYSLHQMGFQNIYIYLMKDFSPKKDILKNECVRVGEYDRNILFYAEMAIIDYCNLNCKGCNHYSPIFGHKLPDFNKRIDDINRLKGIFDRIVEFGLIGGEPLLSSDVIDYIEATRELLPTTQIQMVTNGLLIPSIDEKVLCSIRDNNITVCISPYIPTQKIISEICNRLEQYHIDYLIKNGYSKEWFFKTLSLKIDSKYPRKCISDGCINIRDGKIARCPSVLYVDELNMRFGANLPEEGVLTIEDYASGDELYSELEKRIPLCNHCIDYRFKWEPCGREKRLEDFVVRD